MRFGLVVLMMFSNTVSKMLVVAFRFLCCAGGTGGSGCVWALYGPLATEHCRMARAMDSGFRVGISPGDAQNCNMQKLTLGPIRCTLCVKGSLDPGGSQRTKSTLSPERVHS